MSVKRIRTQSNGSNRKSMYQEGVKAGIEWGEWRATLSELRRLKAERDSWISMLNPNWDQLFNDRFMLPRGGNGWLADVISPGIDASDFWSRAIGSEWQRKVKSLAFLKGFCMAALRSLRE